LANCFRHVYNFGIFPLISHGVKAKLDTEPTDLHMPRAVSKLPICLFCQFNFEPVNKFLQKLE